MKWWKSNNLAKGVITLMCFASLLLPKMLNDDLVTKREQKNSTRSILFARSRM